MTPAPPDAARVGAARRGRIVVPALDGTGPVWLLTVGLLAAAAVVFAVGVRPLPDPSGPVLVSWWLLAAGFLLSEVLVVNYEFRREAHTFSLSEVPLVFGLFFTHPAEIVLAQILGAVVALLLHRRQTGMKLLFNVAHFALGASLATVIFHAVARDAAAFGPSTWVAALLAATTVSALSTLAIFTAISLSERRWEVAKLPEQLGLAVLATVGGGSLGLLGVGGAWHHPAAAGLLLVPLAAFFVGYRAYVGKRQEHNSLRFLYDAARILDQTTDLPTGLARVLGAARTTFRAEVAHLVVLADPDGRRALVVTAATDDDGDGEVVDVPVEDVDGLLHRAMDCTAPHLLGLDPPLPAPGGHRLHQVMMGALRSDKRTFGAVLLGNRLGAAAQFGHADLTLFTMLIGQLGVSLENGHLALMLAEATERAAAERRNALILQRGLRPPALPALEDIAVAVRYLPGTIGAEVGGDWYDAIRLPDGDLGIVIGDVLGHDLHAATRMGRARSALRAYAAEGHSPAAVMQRLNRLMTADDPDFMGTCCYVRFSPRRGALMTTLAGHPPPLLVDPAGTVRLLEADVNFPLGVEPDATYTQTEHHLPDGAALALYTDGLVESRSLPLDHGLQRLTRLRFGASSMDVEQIADRLLDCKPTDPTTDDVTVLVLQHALAVVGR